MRMKTDGDNQQGDPTRRGVLGGLVSAFAFALAGCNTTGTTQPGLRQSVRARIPDRSVKIIDYSGDEPANTILISYGHRQLYHILGDGRAVAYTVAVPQPEDEGNFPLSADGSYRQTTIVREAANPPWTPTPAMRQRRPDIRAYAGGEEGNPMGSYALYLEHGRYFRIHGSSNNISLGEAVSAGCIRMDNEHIEILAQSVGAGTRVKFYQGNIPGIAVTGPRMQNVDLPVLRGHDSDIDRIRRGVLGLN